MQQMIRMIHIGVGAGQVCPVLNRPLFRKKLVGVTIITINSMQRYMANSACSISLDMLLTEEQKTS